MYRYFYIFNLLVLAFLLSSGTDISASEPETPPHVRVYTLSDLCRTACKTAEQIKIQQNDLFIAKEDRKRALSVLIPRATAFGSYSLNREPDEYSPDISAFGVKLNQTFTLNGKEIIALDMSEDAIDEQSMLVKAVTSDYILEVARAYYQILSTQRYVEIAKSDVQRLEKHRQAVQERLDVGQVTKTALFRAEAELSGARTTLVKSENGFKLAKASLQRLVEIDKHFSISNNDIKALKNFVYSYEELKQTALEKRAEIKAAAQQVNIAEKNIQYTRGAYWPTLSLEGSYTNSSFEFDSPRYGTTVSEDAENSSLEANLTFTMFDGGLRAAEVRQALADKKKADLALEMQKKQIILETKSAWLDYETAISVLLTLKDELKSARENFNSVNMQFRYGMADSVDMMDANTLLVKAERELSDAEYSHAFSILGIMRARGDIVAVLTAGGI